MRHTWVLLTLIGCYSPAYRDCEVTCVNGACPSGFDCRDNVCRAAGASRTCDEVLGDSGMPADSRDLSIDGSPNLDTDGDLKNDDVDNCIGIPNPSQENEDGDPLGDVCDPCPIAAAPSAMAAAQDSDGDSVGDLCDPNPTTLGDRKLLFHGLNTQPNVMFFGNMPFNVVDGQATVAHALPDDLSTWVWPLSTLQVGTRPYFIFTRVHIVGIVPAGNNNPRGAGTIDNLNNLGDGGVGCTVGFSPQTSPTNGLHAMEASSGGDNVFISTPTTPPVGIGTVHQVGQAHPNDNTQMFECYESTATSLGAPRVTFGASSEPTVGLRARGMRVAFDYIYVVDSPQPP